MAHIIGKLFAVAVLFSIVTLNSASATIINGETDWNSSQGSNLIIPFPLGISTPLNGGTLLITSMGCPQLVSQPWCVESFTIELPFAVTGVLIDAWLRNSYGINWLYLNGEKLPADPFQETPGPCRGGGKYGGSTCFDDIIGFNFDAPTSLLRFDLYPFIHGVDDYLTLNFNFLSASIEPVATAVPEPSTFPMFSILLIGLGILRIFTARKHDRLGNW